MSTSFAKRKFNQQQEKVSDSNTNGENKEKVNGESKEIFIDESSDSSDEETSDENNKEYEETSDEDNKEYEEVSDEDNKGDEKLSDDEEISDENDKDYEEVSDDAEDTSDKDDKDDDYEGDYETDDEDDVSQNKKIKNIKDCKDIKDDIKSKTLKNTNVWRTIPGYSNFEITSDGRVRNKSTNHNMKMNEKGKSYMVKTDKGKAKNVARSTLLGLAWSDLLDQGKRWKPIKNYPGYEISDDGYVRRPKHHKINKGTKHSGVIIHELTKGEQIRADVLVAEAFIGPRPSRKHSVLHENGNRTDNRLSNIRWATKGEITKHSVKLGLVKKPGRKKMTIQKNLEGNIIATYESITKAAKTIDGETWSIRLAFKNNTEYKGFKWEIKERVKEPYNLPGEIWKKFSMSDKFEVSSFARIRDSKEVRIQTLSHHGYYVINLTIDDINREYQVHRLVREVFGDKKPEGKDFIDHRNLVKTANEPSNLDWVTNTENIQRACGKKINQIDPYTRQIVSTYPSLHDAARKLFPDKSNVNHEADEISEASKNGLRYLGFEWKFVDVKHDIRHLLVKNITKTEKEFRHILNTIEAYLWNNPLKTVM